MEDVRLILFGSPRVERGGRVLAMDTRKALALFAFLALSGAEQQREILVSLLYPEFEPDSARAAFRRTLSTLRGALGEGILSIRREAVGVAAGAHLWVDVLQFQSLVKRTEDLASLSEAANLYHDDFMAGFSLRDSATFDDWQYHTAENLRRGLDGVLERLSSRLASQGDVAGAILAAERRVRLDPLLEEAHRQLMERYARAGQRSAALRQYRECVRTLEQELGVPPLEATTQLYQQILSGKLERSSSPAHEIGSTPQLSQLISQSIPASPPLVGRENEMAGLTQVLRATPRQGRFIAILGEAGVGKTRLAEAFLTQARQSGWVVAQARCYEGQQSLAYAPFIEAIQPLLAQDRAAQRLDGLPHNLLLEASHLLPGLVREPTSPPLSEGPGAQARFFEALRLLVNNLLGDEPPGILFLDDLHWADSGTVDLIAYLARRLQPAGCILLAAWRNEQGPVIDRLNQLLSELQRSGTVLSYPLERMSPADIATLARSIRPTLSPGLARRVFQESEGLPFIALEYLNVAELSEMAWEMPGGVRALLHRRLMEPGETARQLLSAAAVIGRSFDFNTLHAISGRSDWETVSGLEELVRLGLVHEQESSGYDFSHDKLRALAYEETSLARRRLLHARAAETLISAGSGARDAGLVAGLAANHFLQAGQPLRAATYFQQAGEHARRLHANQQALAAFKSALAARPPDPSGLHEACGDLHTLRGEYGAAVASYQAAAAFCAPGCLPNLMHKLGEVYHRRGEWEAAEGHYRAALESAENGGSPAWQAHLFADWSLTAYRANQPSQAQQLAENALINAQQASDAASLSQACNMLGILARARGDLPQAGDFFDRSLQAADSVENLAMRCASLHNLARLEQERGRLLEAVTLTGQALQYCSLLGDRHHQAALLNTLADLHHALGQPAESMDYLKQAVALFAEIGEDVGGDQPEIWKLTEW